MALHPRIGARVIIVVTTTVDKVWCQSLALGILVAQAATIRRRSEATSKNNRRHRRHVITRRVTTTPTMTRAPFRAPIPSTPPIHIGDLATSRALEAFPEAAGLSVRGIVR